MFSFPKLGFTALNPTFSAFAIILVSPIHRVALRSRLFDFINCFLLPEFLKQDVPQVVQCRPILDLICQDMTVDIAFVMPVKIRAVKE